MQNYLRMSKKSSNFAAQNVGRPKGLKEQGPLR